MRVVGVFDAPGIPLGKAVLDLQRDLAVGQLGQEAELALCDTAGGVGHHGVCSPFVHGWREPRRPGDRLRSCPPAFGLLLYFTAPVTRPPRPPPWSVCVE